MNNTIPHSKRLVDPYCKTHYLLQKNHGGVPQTLEVNKNQPVDITVTNNATGQYFANNSTVDNAATARKASAPQTTAGICTTNASARDNEQESSLARISAESSSANIPTNNNDSNANAPTRDYKVAFEIPTNNKTVSTNPNSHEGVRAYP